MKITIMNESGDCKEMLYTKEKANYEVKGKEITDFFTRLSEAYNNDDDNIDDLYECLYNLINYGYLYADDDYDDYSNDSNDDYDDCDDYDDEYTQKAPTIGMKLIDTDVEYYVDGQIVTKLEYDEAWNEKLGVKGSANWDEEGLTITNTNTEEILFIGKI